MFKKIIIILIIFSNWIFVFTETEIDISPAEQMISSRLDAIKNKCHKEPELVIEKAKNILKIAEIHNLPHKIAQSYEIIATSNYFLAKYELAEEYFKKALLIYQENTDNKMEIARIWNSLGNVSKIQLDYEIALEYYLRALMIRKELNDKKSIAVTLNNIGLLYDNLENYNKALEYHYESLDLKEELGDKNGTAISLNNIGLVYRHQGKYEKAIGFFKSYLTIKEQLQDSIGIAKAYNNLGNAYQNIEKFEKSLEYYSLSLEIKRKLAIELEIGKTLRNIGEVYLEKENWHSAKKNFEKSLELAVKLDAKQLLINCYYSFYQFYEKQNDFKKALEYHLLYNKIKDETINNNSPERLSEIYSKYENEKKIKEQLYFLQNNKIENINKKYKFTLIILFFISIGFVVLIINYLWNRSKKR